MRASSPEKPYGPTGTVSQQNRYGIPTETVPATMRTGGTLGCLPKRGRAYRASQPPSGRSATYPYFWGKRVLSPKKVTFAAGNL